MLFDFILSSLNFCPDFLGHVRKQLDKKVILKIHDVTNC